jgi:hypothetical protein
MAPLGVRFPRFSACDRIGLYEVCSELQRHSSACMRNGFVALRLQDAYHAQIGMRAKALYAITTCVHLSVWGAGDTSLGAMVDSFVTRPIASGTERC